jgi:hypothetical protein
VSLGNGAAPRSRPRRSRKWVWFFVALAALTVTAIVIETWYNLRQQLTPAQLEAARILWRERGPHSYEMTYTQNQVDGSDTFAVQVRDQKVVSVTRNGQPLEERLYRYHSIEGLFDDIERFLERDTEPGHPRTFEIARFDPQDGHLLHYVRSVARAHERQEITVEQFHPQ